MLAISLHFMTVSLSVAANSGSTQSSRGPRQGPIDLDRPWTLAQLEVALEVEA